MKERTPYEKCYETMTPLERERNRLVVDLDLVIGGKPEQLLELLSYLDFETRQPSLLLARVVRELEEELGV